MKRCLSSMILPALLLALCGLQGNSAATSAVTAQGDAAGKPKLVVLVVFDQLRGDYLARWKDLYTEGGFKRLMAEGAWYSNCHYPYSETITAPGHASIVTGCSPNKHGIIGNDWYDRRYGEMVTSVLSERYDILRTPPPPKVKEEKKGEEKKTDEKKDPAEAEKKPLGASPLRRKEESIGDVLYRLTQGRSKIVSLSIKDRTAILLAALRAQFVYWFSTTFGGFVTSTYYQEDMHSWVNDFNRKNHADQWFGKDWDRLRTGLDYAKHSGPDDVVAEGTGYVQGRTFPHTMKGGLDKPGKTYYEALGNSPYGSELLLALAKTAIDAEKLGQGDTTDMLCLSFSSNDMVGHCWGPDSQEVLDMTLRTDLLLKDLLDTLDAKVGKGKYLLVLSADHGVCPIPEVAKAQGKDAGTVPYTLLSTQAATFLQEKYAPGKAKLLPWIEQTSGAWIYLNRGVLREQDLTSSAVEQALAEWLVKQPGVQAAYTRTQLNGKGKLDDPLAETVRLSFHPELSGDVKVLLKPYHLFTSSKKSAAYVTTHGSPHPYDTHVPLVVFGTGVKSGERTERVTPQCATPIIAHSLKLPLPTGNEAVLPKGLFE